MQRQIDLAVSSAKMRSLDAQQMTVCNFFAMMKFRELSDRIKFCRYL